MKKIASLMAIAAVSLATASTNVSANEGGYIGIKSGVMDIDVAAYDASMPFGIQAGYAFSNGFAIEGEFTKTNFKLGGADGDITTLAAYGVYRTKGNFYGKVKAGVLNERVKASNRFVSVDGSDTGLSAGVGAGYRFNDSVSLEAEYTLIEQDVNFFSVALNYHF